MNCPYCNHWNIPGADTCENCRQDLAELDHPQASSKVEASMMESTLAKLNLKPTCIVTPDTKVGEVVAILQERKFGCALVGDVSNIVGIFSERDVLIRLADRYEESINLPISEFMTLNPEMLDINTPIAYALNRMSIGDFRHLPITKNGHLEGIISLRAMLSFLSEWYPDLIKSKMEPA